MVAAAGGCEAMSVQMDYQRPSAQTLMIESAPPPFYKTLKSHHAGTMNALDFPDLGGVKRLAANAAGSPVSSAATRSKFCTSAPTMGDSGSSVKQLAAAVQLCTNRMVASISSASPVCCLA